MTTTTGSTLATGRVGPVGPVEPVERPDAPGDAGGLTHRRILLVFSGLMLGMLLAALDATIVATWAGSTACRGS